MMTVALIFVMIYLTPVFRSYLSQFRTQRYGMETDACVTCIDETVSTGGYGDQFIWRSYYVRFLKEDGQVTEARLINPKKQLRRGSRIRIRYIPGRTDCAVLTEITET